MEITYQLEPKDIEAARRYINRTSPALRQAGRLVFLSYVGISVFCSLLVGGRGVAFQFVCFSFMFALLSLVNLAVGTITTQVIYRRYTVAFQQGGLFAEYTTILSDDSLFQISPIGEVRLAWKGIERVDQGKKYIYIQVVHEDVFVIPKRAFADAHAAQAFYEAASSYQAAQRTRVEV